MSRPTAISPEEQEQIARKIGVLLLRSAPEDWQQITVEYRATGEYHDLLGEIATQDGSTDSWEPPEDLLGIFEHLREGMYRPDVGTWLSALYVVERPSSYRIDINFDSEPQWQQPLPRAAYVDELSRYPRAEENVPDWLRAKLDGSGVVAPPVNGTARAGAEQPVAEQAQALSDEVPSVSAPAPSQAEPLSGVGAASAAEAGEPTTAEQDVAEYSAAGPAFAAQSNGATADADVPPSTNDSEDHSPASTRSGGPETSDLPSVSEPGEARAFRTAAVFDGEDEQGRPLVATRSPVHPDEVAGLRHYLENAPIVLASRDNQVDELDAEHPAAVPDTWHTDGSWLWHGAVPYYLAQYGVPPEPALISHIRNQRFALSEIDDRTRDQAVGHLFAEQRDDDGPSVDDLGTGDVSAVDTSVAGEADEQDPDDEYERSADVDESLPVDHEAVESFLDGNGSRHKRNDQVDEDASSDAETQDVLATLHDKLAEYGVDSASYRLGSHTTSALCLLQEGPDWIITPGPQAPVDNDIRFDRPEQAAAYLLGSLLLNGHGRPPAAQPRPEPVAEAEQVVAQAQEPALAEPAVRESAREVAPELDQPDSDQLDSVQPNSGQPDLAQPDSAQPNLAQPGLSGLDHAEQDQPEPSGTTASGLPRRGASTAEPEHAPQRGPEQGTGGHFLFTANQGPFEEQADSAEPDTPDQQRHQDGPDNAPQEAMTRFQVAPGHPQADAAPSGQPGQGQPGQGQPGPAQPGPAQGNPAQSGQPPAAGGPSPTRSMQLPQNNQPPVNGQAQQPGPANNGAAAQPLPKRSPRPDGEAGGPPPQQAGPLGGAAARPGPTGQNMAGPPRQAPPNDPSRGGIKRPPQGGQPQAPQPQSGQPQSGQPQSGQPQSGQPQPGQPQGGQPQQAQGQPQQSGQEIQPLRGEPPLTLYRDRRHIVLQPGTDLDRFGEPGGNVGYAVRTPYSQRSLPPQWANRTYMAYRVQRPVQVLRGTAVPWFEQQGGGTAYVLPVAISDLLADGTLVELSGAEAPHPTMD